MKSILSISTKFLKLASESPDKEKVLSMMGMKDLLGKDEEEFLFSDVVSDDLSEKELKIVTEDAHTAAEHEELLQKAMTKLDLPLEYLSKFDLLSVIEKLKESDLSLLDKEEIMALSDFVHGKALYTNLSLSKAILQSLEKSDLDEVQHMAMVEPIKMHIEWEES